MKPPPFEVADIIRAHGKSFIEKNRSWLTWLHVRVLFAIEHCRTAALGGHLDRCGQCGHEAISFNSCRSRHCPKCQTNARDKWLAERGKEDDQLEKSANSISFSAQYQHFHDATLRLAMRYYLRFV